MQTLSEKEIIHRIREQEPFSAVIENGAFSIKIDRYVPAVSTAIHSGHNVRKQISDKLLLDESERKYEEDPYTGDMLSSFPIVLQGLDSRYQYDLNRSPGECIYEEAWGKECGYSPSVQGNVRKVSLHTIVITGFWMSCSLLLRKCILTALFMICTPITIRVLKLMRHFLISALII